jgi:hypothetical protein
MGTYIASVIATSNGTANTEDVFIQLTAATGKQFKIRRIRMFYRGDATAVGDNNVEARVLTVTVASGGTGTTITPVATEPSMPAPVTTCIVKNGATALAVGTGTVTPITTPSFNERGFYEWVAMLDSERLASGVAGIVELVLKNSAVSRQMAVEIEFEE